MDSYIMASAVAIFVESRLQSGFAYVELEKAVGFSLAHIRDVYAKLTGQSLSRYVLSRKIANAAFDIVYSEEKILDIAIKYGFSNPDSFTRAFRRVTGVNPGDFRGQKRPVGRALICTGVFGVSVNPQDNGERSMLMNHQEQKQVSDGSTVLYGVPKIQYGTFGGITPLPICMKAAANYMGMKLRYDEAIVYSGAAFRLTWNETCWDGGNVGDIFTFDDPSKVFRCAIESLGCTYNLMGRTSETKKENFLDFIREKIDSGIPVIARGIIGPPETGLITGYRDGGDILLGWNVFQDFPEFTGDISLDESGYYITDQWWQNKNTNAVMSFGAVTGERITLKTIVENAIEVMKPRRRGKYAKAGYAYDAWKKAILDEDQFGKDMVDLLLVERLMCQMDAVDCLIDGRKSAYFFFKNLSDENPQQLLLEEIAAGFATAATCAHNMYEAVGGFERGEKQMRAFQNRKTRTVLADLIDTCKTADAKTRVLLQSLLPTL